MKYGVITHKTTLNIGDDIQTYAAVNLLPRVDYVLTRESLDNFASNGNEPVGVLLGHWWLWSKWNWPPAECVYPLPIGMHINEMDIYASGSPLQRDWLGGIGGDYLRAYGPVGCRDASTMELLEACGIEHYLSGCLTLTLPRQKKTDNAGAYACLVDLKPALEAKAREYLKDTGLEIVNATHVCDYKNTDLTFEQRMEKARELLTLYQNARIVLTSRLHAALPCLAMETPIVPILDLGLARNATRWAPYSAWLPCVSEQDFCNRAFDYDFANPPANKEDYLPLRQSLIERAGCFVTETKDLDEPVEAIKKTTFSEAQARQWQYGLMRDTLDAWLYASREMHAKARKQKAKDAKQIADCKAKLADGKKELSVCQKELAACKKQLEGGKKEIAGYKKRVSKMQSELDRLNGMFVVRCVKFARRNAKALLLRLGWPWKK